MTWIFYQMPNILVWYLLHWITEEYYVIGCFEGFNEKPTYCYIFACNAEHSLDFLILNFDSVMINDLRGVSFYLCLQYTYLFNDTTNPFLWADILTRLTTTHQIDLCVIDRLIEFVGPWNHYWEHKNVNEIDICTNLRNVSLKYFDKFLLR